MTMHGAEGMEFSKVILFAVNEGPLPFGYEVSNPPECEARDALLRERSLLYGAATRARDESWWLAGVAGLRRCYSSLGQRLSVGAASLARNNVVVGGSGRWCQH